MCIYVYIYIYIYLFMYVYMYSTIVHTLLPHGLEDHLPVLPGVPGARLRRPIYTYIYIYMCNII